MLHAVNILLKFKCNCHEYQGIWKDWSEANVFFLYHQIWNFHWNLYSYHFGGLQSMGSRRVRYDWATSLSLFTFTHWSRKWHPTPVLMPGKSHGRRNLVGCSPWGREESDTTERLRFHFSLFTFMHWRRKWQPTAVFLPGESQGWGSLVGCRLWGHTELDTTEVT